MHRVVNWLDQQVFSTHHHQSRLGKNKQPTKLSQEDPQNRWSMSYKIVGIKKLKITMSIPSFLVIDSLVFNLCTELPTNLTNKFSSIFAQSCELTWPTSFRDISPPIPLRKEQTTNKTISRRSPKPLIDELQNCYHQEVENYFEHSFYFFGCKIFPKY